jgi:hypothetical protein
LDRNEEVKLIVQSNPLTPLRTTKAQKQVEKL